MGFSFSTKDFLFYRVVLHCTDWNPGIETNLNDCPSIGMKQY